MDIHLRLRWNDPRMANITNITPHEGLNNETVVIPPLFIKKVWTPEIYFPNEKEAKFHHVMVPNQKMKVYPDGTIIYTVR